MGFKRSLGVFIYRFTRRLKSRERIFREIYEAGGFTGGRESLSGPGSELDQTAAIRSALPGLLREFRVRTLLDAPCGDFHWMRSVDLTNVRYIGGDIVATLIEANRRKHEEKGKREFLTLDIVKDPLPAADLVLCRDCLVHLPLREALAAIRNFRKSATYLLTTTFPNVGENPDILRGEWRPLNLRMAPFHFPEPLRLINEECTETGGEFGALYRGKSLGLWRLADLRV